MGRFRRGGRDVGEKMMRRFIKKVRNRLSVSSNTLCIKDTRKTSVSALKMVYYVIIGLAVGEALKKTLLDQNGDFSGKGILTGEKLTTFFLLLAFLSTIVRFVHGASIHLEMDKKDLKKSWKLLWDFVGFVLHAALFYLMAVSLKEMSAFLFSFGLMLGVDALWILAICKWKHYINLEGTSLKWLISDFIIIVLLYGVWAISMTIACVWLPLTIILVIAIGGTVVDYSWNKRFYFPNPLSQK